MSIWSTMIRSVFGSAATMPVQPVVEATAPRNFVSLRAVRNANAMMMAGVKPTLSPETERLLRKYPITSERINEAGRKALQELDALRAAEGGPWWQRDAILQRELKALRGQKHLSVVTADKPEPGN